MDFIWNIPPPPHPAPEYGRKMCFFDHLGRVIDYYSTKFDKFVIMGDFKSEPSDEEVESFCDNLHNLVKEKTCFKCPPKCYDLILTNCKHNFQKYTGTHFRFF